MNVLFHLGNGLLIPPAMFFAWNYYRFKGKEIRFGRLWITMTIAGITIVTTSLQFVYPELIDALNRNKQALWAGEFWRLITPLFIQPMGIGQCIVNGLFFISFVPIAEHLFGRGMLLIYFAVSAMGQLIILYWETTPGGLPTAGGGSSTALFSTIGALFMYIVVNRDQFARGYILIPIAGFFGALVLIFFEDGHAPVVFIGGVVALVLLRNNKRIDSSVNVMRK